MSISTKVFRYFFVNTCVLDVVVVEGTDKTVDEGANKEIAGKE